jgi:hypothetical protein
MYKFGSRRNQMAIAENQALQTAKQMPKLSPQQTAALRDYAEGYEQPNLDNFYTGGTLDFKNRDRVIAALQRKGLIDAEQKITDAGIAALNAQVSQ